MSFKYPRRHLGVVSFFSLTSIVRDETGRYMNICGEEKKENT